MTVGSDSVFRGYRPGTTGDADLTRGRLHRFPAKRKALRAMILLTALFIVSCRSVPGAIPMGTWSYTLFMNGAPIGKALMTSRKAGDTYITVMEMKINAGYVQNMTRQVAVETLDLRPVSLEITTSIKTGTIDQETKTSAVFNGRKVTLKNGDSTASFTMEKPFVIDGNYHIAELIKRKFSAGTEIHSNLYDPTLEPEEPVAITVRVAGRNTMEVNGIERDLIHVQYSIENMKNIDYFLDENGVMVRGVIKMLNNRIDLVIDEN